VIRVLCVLVFLVTCTSHGEGTSNWIVVVKPKPPVVTNAPTPPPTRHLRTFGDFQVVTSRCVHAELDMRYVVGVIHNNSGTRYNYVQVDVNMFHGSTLVGSSFANVAHMDAFGNWRFKVLMTDDDANQYSIVNVTGIPDR